MKLRFPLTNIGYWPAKFRLIAIILVFCLIFFLGSLSFLKPRVLSLHQRNAAQIVLKQQISQQYSDLKNIKLYQLENTKLDSVFNVPYLHLMSVSEAPTLENAILQEANNSDVKIQSFNRQPLVKKEFYSEEVVQVALTGTYYNFALFCNALVSLKTIVMLTDFNMVPNANNAALQMSPDLSIRLTLHLYYLNPKTGAV